MEFKKKDILKVTKCESVEFYLEETKHGAIFDFFWSNIAQFYRWSVDESINCEKNFLFEISSQKKVEENSRSISLFVLCTKDTENAFGFPVREQIAWVQN